MFALVCIKIPRSLRNVKGSGIWFICTSICTMLTVVYHFGFCLNTDTHRLEHKVAPYALIFTLKKTKLGIFLDYHEFWMLMCHTQCKALLIFVSKTLDLFDH